MNNQVYFYDYCFLFWPSNNWIEEVSIKIKMKESSMRMCNTGEFNEYWWSVLLKPQCFIHMFVFVTVVSCIILCTSTSKLVIITIFSQNRDMYVEIKTIRIRDELWSCKTSGSVLIVSCHPWPYTRPVSEVAENVDLRAVRVNN